LSRSLLINDKIESPFAWRWIEQCFSGYLLSSLVVGSFLWLSLFYSFELTLHAHLFFPSLFLMVTYEAYHQSTIIYAIKNGKQYLELALFTQLMTLILMGITYASVGPMMMALIPFGIMMLWSYMLWNDEWKTLRQHFILLVSLVSVMIGLFMKVTNEDHISHSESALYFVFAFAWLSMAVYSFINSVRGLGSLRFERTSISKKDQYFFHDCINHLVGIKLFLSTRSEVKNQDMNLLLREVDLFESLIGDHFKLSHRNLAFRHKFINCQKLPELFEMVMESFLLPRRVGFELVVEPNFQWSEAQLPMAPIQRIASNLIKNAVDHGGEKVIVHLAKMNDASDVMLIKVITQLRAPLSFSKTIESELSKRILESGAGRSTVMLDQSTHGIGLDSVTTLLEELGGEMSLEITNKEWINNLKIPIQYSAELIKKAA
jgi:hypothetical protein